MTHNDELDLGRELQWDQADFIKQANFDELHRLVGSIL